MEARLAGQKELEAAHIRQQKWEEERLVKKLDMKKDVKAGMMGPLDTSTTQSVKLQRYAITPFAGDYKAD